MAITDDYNRADGAIGASWTKEVSGGATTCLISGNEVQLSATGSAERHVYIYNATQPPADCYAQIALSGGAASVNNRGGPSIRFTIDGSGDGYCFRAKCNASDGDIFRYDNGVPTSIRYIASLAGLTTASVLKITASGTTFAAFVDGVQKGLSIVDANYASGYAGFEYSSNQADAANLMELDNFEATAPAATGQPACKRLGGVPHVAVNRGVW